jgi:C-terminal processing protease CtpA/Prc
MIFEPNANVARSDTWDRAGMWLNSASDGFEVMDVVAGGSAEAAGVKVGYRIAAIDNTPVEKLSLSAVRERFRTEPAGTAVKLTVLEGGKRREVTLVLRDVVPRS